MENLAASFKMEVARSSEMLVSFCITT